MKQDADTITAEMKLKHSLKSCITCMVELLMYLDTIPLKAKSCSFPPVGLFHTEQDMQLEHNI